MSIIKNILLLNLSKGSSWSNSVDPTTIDVSILKVVDEKKLSEAYETLEFKIYTPCKKDKLYLFPGCTVPRFKIREMWKSLGVSVTIKETNGTHKFISSNSDKYIEGVGNSYEVPANMIKLWIDYHSEDFDKYNLSEINYNNWEKENLDMFNDLLDNNEKIYINYSFHTLLRDHNMKLLGYSDLQKSYISFPIFDYKDIYKVYRTTWEEPLIDPISLPEEYYSCNVYTKIFKEDYISDVIENTLNGNHSSYYLDTAINKSLQDASPEIDEDMYDQMCNLLKSSDKDNHTLAMEVLANCNIEKSAVYVFDIMREFHQTMRYNKSYNSVNFKTFRESSGLDIYYDYNEETKIEFLHKYSQLDMNVISSIQSVALSLANKVIKNTYGNLINQDILDISFPLCKVVMKGINDNPSINIIDAKELDAEEDLKNNPATYGISETVHILDNIDEVNPDDEELIEGVTEALEELSIISEDVCEVDHVAESEDISVNDLDKEEDDDFEAAGLIEIVQEPVQQLTIEDDDTLENLEDLEFKADEEMQETKTEEIQNEKDKEDKEDNWWENSLETNVTPVDDDFDFD